MLSPGTARPLRTVLATLAVSLAALAGGASQASADSYGCTWAPFGNVCILIEGSGRYVDHVRVRRAKVDWSLICNYRAKMVVRGPDGRRIDVRRTRLHSGCSVAWAWFDWYPRRKYPHNSTICTSFFEDGVLQGKPCNKVLR